MHSINPNMASPIIQNPMNDVMELMAQNEKFLNAKNVKVTDGGACTVAPGTIANNANFEAIMGKVANFKDMMFTAQDTMSLMKVQGEAISHIINRAQEGEHSEEEIEKMNAEAASRVDEINKLFQNANFNNINPLKKPFSLEIPNWQDFIKQFSVNENKPMEESEEVEEGEVKNETNNVLTDIDFNVDRSADLEEGTFPFAAFDNVKIGCTDDGALQINVDATMDFDLSGILEKGVQSDDSTDLINNFINLLNGKQNDMNSASSFLDSILKQVGISIDDFVQDDETSSSFIQGQIVQNARITLANCANQIPSIAVNLL